MGVISSTACDLVPDVRQLLDVAVRLLLAILAGGLLGYQRERTGKAAGLRTHMLVALGTAMFVVSASTYGLTGDSLSRVLQGVIAGIGFLGTGAILKLTDQHEIHGLTTAAGIWVTAAVGIAIGLGQIGIGLTCTVITWVVLALFQKIEKRFRKEDPDI